MLFFLNLLSILNQHWCTPVFVVHPALHLDMLKSTLHFDLYEVVTSDYPTNSIKVKF